MRCRTTSGRISSRWRAATSPRCGAMRGQGDLRGAARQARGHAGAAVQRPVELRTWCRPAWPASSRRRSWERHRASAADARGGLPRERRDRGPTSRRRTPTSTRGTDHAEGQFAEHRHDKDGQLWARKLGSQSYEPISEQEVRTSYETGVEAVGQGIGRGVESAARGIPQAIADLVRPVNEAIAGPFGWEYDEGAATANRGRLQEIADAQRGSAGANPLAAPLGFFAARGGRGGGHGRRGRGRLAGATWGALRGRGLRWRRRGIPGGSADGRAPGPRPGACGGRRRRGDHPRPGARPRQGARDRRGLARDGPAGGARGAWRRGARARSPARRARSPASTRARSGAAGNRGCGMRMSGFLDAAPDEALNREAAELGFRLTPGVARGSTGAAAARGGDREHARRCCGLRRAARAERPGAEGPPGEGAGRRGHRPVAGGARAR